MFAWLETGLEEPAPEPSTGGGEQAAAEGGGTTTEGQAAGKTAAPVAGTAGTAGAGRGKVWMMLRLTREQEVFIGTVIILVWFVTDPFTHRRTVDDMVKAVKNRP